MKPAFQKMAAVGTAGFAALTGAIALSVKETIADEAAMNRLAHILRTSRDATDEQIESLYKQADALERVGVISAGSIIQAQAQLATFDLQSESIEKLIPSILDYVVAEKGAAATTEDLRGLTNGLAQALQGNFASLTKTGFVLDDATKALIANGTEAERAAALVDVLNSTYKGFNEAARNTTEGGIIAMNNELNRLRATIGKQFLPIIQEITTKLTPLLTSFISWIEANPELFRTITIVVGGLFALLAVVGLLGLAIPALSAGFADLAVVIGFLVSPIGLIVLGIAALIAIGVLLYKNWDTISAYAVQVWGAIKQTFEDAWNAISAAVSNAWNAIVGAINTGFEWIKTAFWFFIDFVIGWWAMLFDLLVPGWRGALAQLWADASLYFKMIGEYISGVMTSIKTWISDALKAISEVWNSVWGQVKDYFSTIWETIKSVASSAFDFIQQGIDKLLGPLQRLIDMAQSAFNAAKSAVSSVGGSISSGIQSIVNTGKAITGRAGGGPVFAGTPYIVGENGPELFVPGSSGSIIPNGRSAGGPTFQIVITGNTLLDRDSARKIGDQLVRYLKDNIRI